MHFEHHSTIPTSKDKLWDFLMDVPAVSTCVPGVQEVFQEDEDTYRGTLRVKVGPIALSLQGIIRVTERDKDAGRAGMKAEAADKKIGGSVDARMGMVVQEQGPNATALTITTDANVMGRIGEFGQPVIKKKTEQMMAEFAENLKKKVVAG